MCSVIGSRNFSPLAQEQHEQHYERWLATLQKLLHTHSDEQLNQLMSVPARYHPMLVEKPMTMRNARCTPSNIAHCIKVTWS